ncbi:MAG TPA: tRNA lysidine(34) synthetase TilS [Burkholderiales bacterium]|nr:tRNA lysidine(34) synthetase TilS [Burkholderiales bacterium]
MASSKKSPRCDLRAHVAGVLAKTIKPAHHLVLGLSGGIDSMVLLDILKSLSRKLRFKLSAVHVNHQLSPNASSWARFCERQCGACGVTLRVAKVKISGAREIGLEAAARQARYLVYRKQPADYIVLAHHLDDQAETLLLQLLRGSGVKGSSAMRDIRIVDSGFGTRKAGLCILRPLLDVPRSEIERYAKSRKLKWIEDESNDNTRLDRNFLRHKVFSVVEKHFPAYRETLGRAGRHFAEAADLLDELAELDSRAALQGGKLKAAALRELAPARARNLLRYYFAQIGLLMPSAKRLDEILRQIAHAREDAKVRVALGELEVRRFKGNVYVCRAHPALDPKFCLRWQGEEKLEISELGGVMALHCTQGKGMDYAKLMQEPVTIRVRRGGEKLRPDCKRPRRTLKDLLQESKIAPWERSRLPLLFSGEHLVCVPGIGIDCDYQATAGQKGLSVNWQVNYTGSCTATRHA